MNWESDDVYECASIIQSSFTLNSAGRSPATRRAEQRSRTAHRRQNVAPLRMTYEDPAGKENMSEELSFYQHHVQASPRSCSPCDNEIGLLSPETTPSKFTFVQNNLLNRQRRPLEEHDPNSMDSGYGASYTSDGSNSQNVFRFAQPTGVAPRKSPKATKSPSSLKMFHSLSSGSMESMDDEYMELFDMDAMDHDAQLPSDLNSLICGDIKSTNKTPENKRPIARRSLSLSENATVTSRVKNNLFIFEQQPTTPEILVHQDNITSLNLTPYSSKSSSDLTRCFKRPEPPGLSPVQSKRYKIETETALISTDTTLLNVPGNKRPVFQKSISLNEASIKSALSRSTSEPDLIGDFSKSYVLPLMTGRHSDLKSISVDIMAQLVRGEFDNKVASFKVIDCRYPYEFEGGHIRGAKNLYTQEEILEDLIKSKTEIPKVEADAPTRNIIVFHCEFSSERGPKLSRFLRNHDRILNSDSYPALHYPEIYLLHGGYKDFFNAHPDLCDPTAYRPMLDPNYGDAYRHFRAKSKSWNGDIKGSAVSSGRLVKSRSRLVL